MRVGAHLERLAVLSLTNCLARSGWCTKYKPSVLQAANSESLPPQELWRPPSPTQQLVIVPEALQQPRDGYKGECLLPGLQALLDLTASRSLVSAFRSFLWPLPGL